MTQGSGATTGTGQAYGEAWYWDNRYAQEPGPFDWYQKYPSLKPLLNLYVPFHHRILTVGCGNSAFSEGMVDDGYEDVVNIDISSVVIEAMQKKYSNRPQLKCKVLVFMEVKYVLFHEVEVFVSKSPLRSQLSLHDSLCLSLRYIDVEMDARDMSSFEGGSFDAIVDKGTLDSILCGHNSQQNAAKMLTEVGRVLKNKGVYILITYGTPVYRLPLLRNSGLWSIKLHAIDKLLPEEKSQNRKWELTSSIPLDGDGKSVEAMLGENPDVHYIYVCIKDNR